MYDLQWYTINLCLINTAAKKSTFLFLKMFKIYIFCDSWEKNNANIIIKRVVITLRNIVSKKDVTFMYTHKPSMITQPCYFFLLLLSKAFADTNGIIAEQINANTFSTKNVWVQSNSR